MVLLPPPSTTTIDGGGSDGDNDGYDRPIVQGSLQPLPFGRAVERNVCLTVISDGVVRLGVGLLVVGLLVSRAVGRDVGLMDVGDGVVGLGVRSLVGGLLDVGEFFFNKCCRLMFSILPAPSRSHLHQHLPPARASVLPSRAEDGHRCHRRRR
jgi:hypothetical protein